MNNELASWFQALPENGGVKITDLRDPLGFVWQEPDQVREIIAKLESALAELAAHNASKILGNTQGTGNGRR